MQLFVDLLKDETWGMDAAKVFRVISSEDELLNKSNHAIIRLLHKQRFFMFVFPQIVSSASSQTINSGSHPIPSFTASFLTIATRSNYLIALSNIISNIPKEILLPELPTLLPLLLQSLNLPSPVLRANALNTLYVMVIESPEIVSPHLETMIPILTSQITISPSNPPKVRIAALRCLAILPSQLNFTAVDPFQKMVIRAIGGVLDDPKRVVRKEAVDCRHAWYISGGKLA